MAEKADKADNKKYKIVNFLLVGNSAVGKTSVIRSYEGNKFNPNYISTIGQDFTVFTKDNFPIDDQLVDIKAKVWDSAGQERFKSIVVSSLKNTEGIILIYDVTNPVTFQDCEGWLGTIKDHQDISTFPMFFVGNKIDLERKVDKENAEAFAKKYNLRYFEISAKTGEGVKEVIDEFIVEVYKKGKEKNGINLNEMNAKSKKVCCS